MPDGMHARILGIGIDLCPVARMRGMKQPERFLARYFTEDERVYIAGKHLAMHESLAGHFAAKEALVKALGCGIVLPLSDIAITHDGQGAPHFLLRGQALERFQALGGKALHLSITHTDDMAAAVAIVEG